MIQFSFTQVLIFCVGILAAVIILAAAVIILAKKVSTLKRKEKYYTAMINLITDTQNHQLGQILSLGNRINHIQDYVDNQ